MRPVRGFTVVELLVAVAVVAVITIMAIPTFATMVANRRVSTAAQEMFTTLLYARSEAIRLNGNVVIEPRTDSNWSTGWQVKNGATVLRETVRNGAVAVEEATGATTVTYTGSGRLVAASSPVFSFCIADKAKKRELTVDLSGRPNLHLNGECDE